MRARTFGRTGWQVSELGVGMWGVTGWTGTDEVEAGRALQLAVDLGCTFFDTAWAYGDGAGERILGALVRDNPGRSLRTATKVPPRNRRWPARRGDRIEDVFPPDHILVIYNVFDQAPEEELFPACREHGVGVIARVPFDEGSLTGSLTLDSSWPEGDWRNTYFVPENLAATVERVERLRPLADGITMSELALRFVLTNPDVATVIPGMRSRRHVQANADAAAAGPLRADVARELRAHRWDRVPTAWSQ